MATYINTEKKTWKETTIQTDLIKKRRHDFLFCNASFFYKVNTFMCYMCIYIYANILLYFIYLFVYFKGLRLKRDLSQKFSLFLLHYTQSPGGYISIHRLNVPGLSSEMGSTLMHGMWFIIHPSHSQGSRDKKKKPTQNQSMEPQKAEVGKVGGNCSEAQFRSIITKRQNHWTVRDAQKEMGHTHTLWVGV